MLGAMWMAGCRDEGPVPHCSVGDFEYLMIGSFYGECAGEDCIQIYKIDKEHLYEDTLDIYPGGQEAYPGSFVRLDDALFAEVKDIVEDFPFELLQEEETVIGMPDGGDWGGKYVEWKVSGFAPRFWLLDNMKVNLPEAYHAFVDRIQEKINVINE